MGANTIKRDEMPLREIFGASMRQRNMNDARYAGISFFARSHIRV